MSIEFDTTAENCAPRNVLFCCRSPICLNNSPQLVPVLDHSMDLQHQNQKKIFPVCVPDLSDNGPYSTLMSHRIISDNAKKNKIDSTSDLATSSQPHKPHQINKSQSAQDVRHYGVSLRRVTPPKCTVSVKKNENPMMNVVLRKVLIISSKLQSKHFKRIFVMWTLI